MKKIYALAAALILFAQGAGNSGPLLNRVINRIAENQKVKEDFNDGEGTPENSVLVYGRIPSLTSMHFLQMDSNFPADSQDATVFNKNDSVFCLAPVAPGSYYMAGYICAVTGKFITSGYFTLQGSFWDFRAPSKPGLYYYGAYSFYASDKAGERIALAEQKLEELKCLKLLEKRLKKTSWNDVIQKRIVELEGESK